MAKRRNDIDEMDLSREDAQRRAEERAELPLPCPCCGTKAEIASAGCSVFFPLTVRCSNLLCAVQTQPSRLLSTALAIWNRRVAPPANGLIDKPAAARHTPQRHPRSSGRRSAAGKSPTGRKGGQSK